MSTNKNTKFEGSRLQYFIEKWKCITSDPIILQIVENCFFDFDINDLPCQEMFSQRSFNEQELNIMDKQVKKLLADKVITPVNYDKTLFLSPTFLRAKKNGEHRLILNLKKLNEYLPYEHFKMDHFENALNLVSKNMFFASLDISKAYYSIPIAIEQRRFFCFLHRNQVYQYVVMPNGIGPGPRLFTKLMKPVYSNLRNKGHMSSGFIDDSLLLGQTKDICVDNVFATANLMSSLGFILNADKSVIVPTQVIVYLGNVIDSVQMIVYLPLEKKNKIKQACEDRLSQLSITIRQLSQVIGLIVSAFSAVEYGKLHYRELERAKICNLKSNKGNFDAKMTISKPIESELLWWINNVNSQIRRIRNTSPVITIQTDSSLEGYGAVFESKKFGGRWSESEKRLHINALEMLAILFAVKVLKKEISGKHIKILSDSTTAISYVNNFGGLKSIECDKISKQIWEFCIRHDIWLTCSHIPGVQNEADKPSRVFQDHIEWELDQNVFYAVCKSFGKPDIDLFATRLNAKLTRFCSWKPDPEAENVNAFSINWGNFKFVYLFPPFSQITRCIQKIQSDRARGIFILPLWTTQTYFPAVMRILVKRPLILPKTKLILNLGQTDREHPLAPKMVMIACQVSGDPTETEAFQMEQPKFSCLHGEIQQSVITKHIYRDGFCSAVNDRLIKFQFL